MDQVLGTFSNNAGAVDVGGGISIGLPDNVKLFVEARYFHSYTSKTATEMVPITMGLRC